MSYKIWLTVQFSVFHFQKSYFPRQYFQIKKVNLRRWCLSITNYIAEPRCFYMTINRVSHKFDVTKNFTGLVILSFSRYRKYHRTNQILSNMAFSKNISLFSTYSGILIFFQGLNLKIRKRQNSILVAMKYRTSFSHHVKLAAHNLL